ncbi:hypothetical protein [Achromobacter xylosoxidans]|uniref:hypothetical protein n=1 Tax=Alcaligenes xylosoxydans xylosoxydans TaxID=85698 RepID=UPI002367FA94|nr:hypothetical protein [Achromobacter xylosoxidans]MDD7993530.1 hypothetical protein [Achromobacter xylosoxidans]
MAPPPRGPPPPRGGGGGGGPHRGKLIVLSTLVTLFFCGGVVGAYSFFHYGFGSTLPLALFLLVLAAVPVADDIRHFFARP